MGSCTVVSGTFLDTLATVSLQFFTILCFLNLQSLFVVNNSLPHVFLRYMSRIRAALVGGNAPSNQTALNRSPIQRGLYSRYPNRLARVRSVLCSVIIGWCTSTYQCCSPSRHVPSRCRSFLKSGSELHSTFFYQILF